MGRGTDLLKKSLACGGEVFLLARGAGGFFGEIAGGMGRRRCLTFAAACHAGVAKRMGGGRLCKTHIELGKIGVRPRDGAARLGFGSAAASRPYHLERWGAECARGAGGRFGKTAGGMTSLSSDFCGAPARLCKISHRTRKDWRSAQRRRFAPGVWVRCGEPTLPFGTMGRRRREGRGRAFWGDCWRDGSPSRPTFAAEGRWVFRWQAGRMPYMGLWGSVSVRFPRHRHKRPGRPFPLLAAGAAAPFENQG
jgi:hypothetical protein